MKVIKEQIRPYSKDNYNVAEIYARNIEVGDNLLIGVNETLRGEYNLYPCKLDDTNKRQFFVSQVDREVANRGGDPHDYRIFLTDYITSTQYVLYLDEWDELYKVLPKSTNNQKLSEPQFNEYRKEALLHILNSFSIFSSSGLSCLVLKEVEVDNLNKGDIILYEGKFYRCVSKKYPTDDTFKITFSNNINSELESEFYTTNRKALVTALHCNLYYFSEDTAVLLSDAVQIIKDLYSYSEFKSEYNYQKSFCGMSFNSDSND